MQLDSALASKKSGIIERRANRGGTWQIGRDSIQTHFLKTNDEPDEPDVRPPERPLPTPQPQPPTEPTQPAPPVPGPIH